jgi:hypothetical protein
MSPIELGSLLEKVEHASNKSANLPYYLSSLFRKKLAPDQSLEVLLELVRLARLEPVASDEYGRQPISQRYRWLRKVLPTVLFVLLNKEELTQAEMETASTAIDLIGSTVRDFSSEREFGEKLRQRINFHASLRKHYFWHHVRSLQARGTSVRLHDLFGFNSLMELRNDDWAWWLAGINPEMSQVDAELAFDCAFQLFHSRGKRVRDAFSFYLTIKELPDLKKRFLSSAHHLLRQKIVWTWQRSQIGNLFRKHWWRRMKIWFDEERAHLWWRIRLRFNLSALRSGKQWRWLYSLVSQANESSKWGVTNWDEVKNKYGESVAIAAEQGCKAAWRNHKPELPHEKHEPGNVAVGVIVGLSGLNSELGESIASVVGLTPQEAELATRYAVNEMNGFSLWLQPLAVRFPAVVGAVLNNCVEQEWDTPPDRPNSHDVIADLVYYGDGLRPLVANSLKILIQNRDPINLAILRHVGKLLTSDDVNGSEVLGRVAAQRATTYSVTSAPFYFWISMWLQTDASAALIQLERILPEHPNPTEGMVAICSHLAEDRRGDVPHLRNPDYVKAEHLARFIALVFRWIRIAEDVHYEGGHSPTARDDAGRFRDGLIARLSISNDSQAVSLLLQLRSNPDLELAASWIKSLYERRVVEGSEAIPWKEPDIRDFEANHERTPRNDQDLFNLIVDRLRDIQNEVERSDNSSRAELNKDHNEADFRRWVTRRLRSNALERYTAPEESEVDWERYPDIRIENPHTQPVSIEMKWADKWTIPQLIEGLEGQLVGHYLRSETSRFGIYLLGNIGRKQTWRDGSRHEIPFSEVVEILRNHARTLVDARPGELGLQVISIDFIAPARG